MNVNDRIHRAPRLGVAALLCLGTLALAPAPLAHGEPGNGQGQGQQQTPAPQTPAPQAPGQGNPGQGNPGQGNPNPGQGNPNPGQGNPNPGQGNPNPGQGNANPGQGNPNPGQGNANPGQGNANPGQGNPGQGGGGQSSDPAGNNGTVKIAPLGDFDGIPNNTPHVGCTFLVEWYGFDEGASIRSTVSFAEHAPTTGVGMTVSGPSPVFVGGDPASGAGTPTGLDGREAYTLSFTGAPHPKQGYHVKLTISTPGSIGNDTKTKVFWVQGCAPVTPPTPPTTPETPEALETPETSTTPNTPTTPETPNTPEVLPEEVSPEVVAETAPEVLGVQAFASSNNNTQQQSPQSQRQLPTAVNAGASDASAPSGTTSLLGLLLVLMGAVAGRLGWVRVRG